MNCNDYIKYIQQEIADKKEYDSHIHAFEEYRTYLEEELAQGQNTVELTCQLAAVYQELRRESECSIQMLEDLLCVSTDLSERDKARIYTNLAFYYEDEYDMENNLRCLEEAVGRNPNTPQAYDALGKVYLKDDDEKALPLFKKAEEVGDSIRYRYNHAVALYQLGKVEEAKGMFEALYLEDENDRQIAYGLGACCFYTSEEARALAMANVLATNLDDEDIGESEIADLYYLCGEHALHNEMYQKAVMGYYPEASWLAPYFYSLYVRGKTEELAQYYMEIMEQKDRDSKETQAEETEEGYTEEDKMECLALFQREKDEITEAYCRILYENYKPDIEIALWLRCGCYLIDCPRHQQVND